MKRFYYATIDENKNAHVWGVYENENIITKLKSFNFAVVHPCSKYSDAVKIVEVWKAAQK